MRKLKTILQFNICLILIISFTIKINKPVISKYNKNEKIVYGIITSCETKEDKVTIIIKGKENLIINYYDNYKCTLGKKIKAEGTLIKPNKNTVFYLFNYRKYLLSKKIKYTFKAVKIENIKENVKLKYKIKNKIIKHINKYKSKDYLKTFILDDNSEIDQNIKESYKNNGISHLLALSGMHVIIISYIISNLLNIIIKNKNISKLLTLYILIFYLFITCYPPSLIRAVISYTILNIKEIFNIKINRLYAYMIIILILLNINPYYIYSLGFLLSFTITIYIIIFNKIINNSSNYFIKTLKISLISFLASLPYIINNFFQVNILSILINLLFVPIISFIIYPLSIITFIIKPLDNIFYNITKLIENISLKIENFTILKMTLCHMNLLFFILYFILIFGLLIIWQRKNKNYLWIILIVMIMHNNINIFNFNEKITTIDIGQGDSILIKLKNNKGNILIDTGGNSENKSYNISKNIVIPYLKAEGIKKLDYLILTHGDFDHMGEAIDLVNNFRVEKVIFNCGEYNDLEKELIKVLDKKHIKYYSCISELNIDKNKLYFLNTKEYDNENDNSNVIYTELNGYKFIFMGDASVTTENEILNTYNLPDIDVLKVGHHGSKTSSSIEFINEINPKYSIISVGKNNRYGHPNKKVLDNLNDSKVYRTDQDGSIMFKIKNNKLKVETCVP